MATAETATDIDQIPAQAGTDGSSNGVAMPPQSVGTALYRSFAWVIVVVMLVFLANNYLNFWRGWPGVPNILAHYGVPGFGTLRSPLTGSAPTLGLIQLATYVIAIFAAIAYVMGTSRLPLRDDAKRLSALAAYIVRAAFWAVLLVGVVDAVISFLRVESFLPDLIGSELAARLEQPQFRGPYVHVPLIGLSLLIALLTRSLGFIWLAFLVVVAEFIIVVTRFIFSYEQAFMGDLVRFWYAGLFLFASAYTLLEEGHVRVDVLYAGFSRRTRGFVNAFGSVFLGIILCWVILLVGLWGKSNIINSPLLTIEVTQQGFGMYVKYLMAGFLAVYAVSMLVQFASSFLDSIADIRGDPGGRAVDTEIIH